MELADLEAVTLIEHQSTPHGWSKKIFEQSLKSNCCVVLQGENYPHLLGFCVLQKIVDELHLLNICIAKEYQQRGWGQTLLNGIIAVAKDSNFQDIHLEVRISNLAARNLYHNTGFNDVGIRENYYSSESGREDALQMCYSIF